jgi:hypothetical protein
MKDGFHQELERVFDTFLKYHMKIMLGDFNAEVVRKKFSNQQLGTCVYTKLVTIMELSKSLIVKSTKFPHRNIHKFTWTSPDGKIHNQIDRIFNR